MRDTFTAGTVAGIVGVAVMYVLSLIFEALGLIAVSVMEISASFFLDKDQVATTAGRIVGAASFLFTGAGGGVLLAYFIKVSGKDFYWLKGLALGGLMVLTVMGFTIGLLDVAPQMHEDSTTMLFHIIESLVYGLVTGYVIFKYGRFRVTDRAR